MNVSRWTRSFAIGSTAAVLALTAGCGSSGPGKSDSSSSSTPSSSETPSPSSSSTASTPAEPTNLTASDIGKKLTAAQKGAGSYAFQVTTTLSGQTIKGSGEASVKGAKPEVHTTMDIGGGSVEVVLFDGFIYLKSPMFKTDKPWLKIDPKAKTGVGALFGQLGGASDPSQNLAAMFNASKVTRTGSEKVGGVDTTRYTVVLPRAALANALNYPPEVVRLLPPKLTYGVWVDADDLVRKFASTLKVQNQKSTTVVTFDKYGEPVSISAPPAGQITTKSPIG